MQTPDLNRSSLPCKLATSTFALLSFALTQQVAANPITDTHIFRAGAFAQNLDVSAYAARHGNKGADLDFDQFLGVDDSITSPFFMYEWHFLENWGLQIHYSRLDTDGKKLATRDFTWDGKEFTAGLLLDSEFKLDTFLVSANYYFIRDEKKDLALGFGLHAFDIDTTIGAEVGLEGGENTGNLRIRNTSELLAPLPNLRGSGTYMLTDKWSISGSLGWLSFNYEDYDGDYLYINAATEYRFTERFGIGFAYMISEIDVTHEGGRSEEHFDIDIDGPSLYLTYGF